MKINVFENDKVITRDMTPEEEAEYLRMQEETSRQMEETNE